jgi:hypothetical protein
VKVKTYRIAIAAEDAADCDKIIDSILDVGRERAWDRSSYEFTVDSATLDGEVSVDVDDVLDATGEETEEEISQRDGEWEKWLERASEEAAAFAKGTMTRKLALMATLALVRAKYDQEVDYYSNHPLKTDSLGRCEKLSDDIKELERDIAEINRKEAGK